MTKADVAELVDARDLKSLDGNVVWVRVPPPAPTQISMCNRDLLGYVRNNRETAFDYTDSIPLMMTLGDLEVHEGATISIADNHTCSKACTCSLAAE